MFRSLHSSYIKFFKIRKFIAKNYPQEIGENDADSRKTCSFNGFQFFRIRFLSKLFNRKTVRNSRASSYASRIQFSKFLNDSFDVKRVKIALAYVDPYVCMYPHLSQNSNFEILLNVCTKRVVDYYVCTVFDAYCFTLDAGFFYCA